MQGKIEGGGVTGVVDKLVSSGMAGKFETTTDHPFIKAFEPAKPAPAFQIDMGGVHHFLDRGIPAQTNAVHLYIEDPHAPGGDDPNFESPIIQGQKLHPFLFSSF